MSNKFTTNSRFAALVDDTISIDVFNKKNKSNRNKKNENSNKKEENQITEKKTNVFKSNYVNLDELNFKTNFDSNKNKERKEKYNNEKEHKIIKKKEEDEKQLLSIDNFPVLLENINSNNTNTSNNTIKYTVLKEGFIDKVKFVKPIVEPSKIENYIKPGWIEIKLDKKTQKIITTNRNPTQLIEENGNDVLKELVYLHKKRTKEYIDLWGYDMWDKVFQFPNYDYDYFNKLDEKYDEEMEDYNIDNDENDDEYSDDYIS